MADDGRPGGAEGPFRALRHRNFAIFWTGAVLSNIGSWLSNLTVPYVLYQLTGSALWTGVASLAQFGPHILLTPVAGMVADRCDRRAVLLSTQTGMAVTAIAMWWLWGSNADSPYSPYLLLVLVSLMGALQGINLPSWQAFVNDLLPREDLASGITLNSLQYNAPRAIGPAIAGVTLATLGATWAFLFNALSFGTVIIALLLIQWKRTARPARSSPRTGFFVAFRYLAGQPGISVSIALAFAAGVLANPILNFTVVFAESVFMVGAVALGLLNAAYGIGSVIAAPYLASSRRVSHAIVARQGLLFCGVGLTLFALAPNVVVGGIGLVFLGGGFLAVMVSTNTSLQMIVAPHIRGRVIAVRIMLYSSSFPLGALVQTALSDVVGPRPVVLTAGILLLGITVAFGLGPGWQLLRRLDDPPDLEG